MSLIGNIIWIVVGGLPIALLWFIAGTFWGVTIVGIPIAKQCFKLARLQLAPFGTRVEDSGSGGLSLLANVFWIVLGGIELAVINLVEAAIFAVTIIGIPLARQSVKMAQLSLAPFGKRIVPNRR